MNKKTIVDGKGHIIGYEFKDITTDGRGRIVACYNQSSNRTLGRNGDEK